MNKIILTVDSQGVDWGVGQGIREIIQNAIDADTKGYSMKVSYNKEDQTLSVVNKGISIPKSSLLIGFSTKKGDNSQIGEFGEGYKLGCVALLKNGLSVEILTAKEVWKPILEHSLDFEREVLAFEVHPSSLKSDDVIFTVKNLSSENWDQAKKQFLMFDDKRGYQSYETSEGQVLDGPKYAGRVYVGGILIEQISSDEDKYEYGYNFKPGRVRVDRDRKMADRYELKNMTSKCLTALANSKDEFFDDFEKCLKNNSTDIRRTGSYICQDLRKKLYKSFVNNYGLDYLPVENESEAKEAAFYGKRGKVFGEAYVGLLQSHTGSIWQLKESFGKKVEKLLDPLVLKKREQKHLLKAKETVSIAVPDLPEITIGQLNKGSDTFGLYYRNDDKVMLNRSILKDYGRTLATLVHEVAHRAGGDGSKEHHDEMERIWIAIVTGPKRKSRKVSESTKMTAQ